jgi:anti-sigma factor RsiW
MKETPMTDTLDHTQDQLADYLGGEMTPAQARAFEARMENDPTLAQQAVALKQTLHTLDVGLAPTHGLQPPAARPLAHIGWAIARYAAVAAIAFTLGAGALTHVQNPSPNSLNVTTHIENNQSQDPAPEKLAELHVDSGLAQSVLRIIQ